MAASLPLAACIVAFHLCLLLSPSCALRWLAEAESSLVRHGVGIRPAYHFLPAKNWQNGTYVRVSKDGVCELLPGTKLFHNELNMWVMDGSHVRAHFILRDQ